ncbi:DivIVA domain-containing protein [Plantactinospora sonchi]|uniref:Cell wall synthesis protein Wag31 n=1 Tax=Plantactinospora sonchi TaxID=1544735 RepID=A0ABU7RSH6_9ACTN
MIYRAGDRLGPHLVRAVTFGVRRWRGLDPDQVYAFLRRVADEMDRLHREVATARTEAERIRQGLRQWQSRHGGCRRTEPPHPDRPPEQRSDDGRHHRGQERRNGGHW